MQLKCLVCLKVFGKKQNVSRKKWETMKSCSRSCATRKNFMDGKMSIEGQFKKGFVQKDGFKKGHKPWNKGLSVCLSPETAFKPFENLNEDHPLWKGDDASIKSKHSWVKRRMSAWACGKCGITRKEKVIDWANLFHTYKRNLEDWLPMCRSCHRNHDIAVNNY